LWDVLIDRDGAVVLSLVVAPCEAVWIACLWNLKTIVGAWAAGICTPLVAAGLHFLLRPDLALVHSGS